MLNTVIGSLSCYVFSSRLKSAKHYADAHWEYAGRQLSRIRAAISQCREPET